MRNTLVILIALLGLNLTAQNLPRLLEENADWSKYTTVIEKTPYGKNHWKTAINLKNGKIDNYKSYYNDDLRGGFTLVYDNDNHLKYTIVTVIINNQTKIDTLKSDAKYNQTGLKIEDNYSKYTYNNSNLLESNYAKTWETSNQKEGWTIRYVYDDAKNIIRKERTEVKNGKTQINIEEYTYDQYNNVLTISRTDTPERQYPTISIGGRGLQQQETFEYEYNDDHLWTAKYLIGSDDKKILLAEREIK